jgi:hypothetical protein
LEKLSDTELKDYRTTIELQLGLVNGILANRKEKKTKIDEKDNLLSNLESFDGSSLDDDQVGKFAFYFAMKNTQEFLDKKLSVFIHKNRSSSAMPDDALISYKETMYYYYLLPW